MGSRDALVLALLDRTTVIYRDVVWCEQVTGSAQRW
jgi:hypothetical protein